MKLPTLILCVVGSINTSHAMDFYLYRSPFYVSPFMNRTYTITEVPYDAPPRRQLKPIRIPHYYDVPWEEKCAAEDKKREEAEKKKIEEGEKLIKKYTSDHIQEWKKVIRFRKKIRDGYDPEARKKAMLDP